jgi:hypothetical protein
MAQFPSISFFCLFFQVPASSVCATCSNCVDLFCFERGRPAEREIGEREIERVLCERDRKSGQACLSHPPPLPPAG